MEVYQELENGKELKVLSKRTRHYEKDYPQPFFNTFAHYKDYLDALAPSSREELRALWKQLQKQNIQMGEFPSFKDALQYRKDGARVYQALRKMNELRPFIKASGPVLTFEKDSQLLGIIFLNPGINGHYFFHFYRITHSIPAILYIQYALMRFFELKDAKKLSFYPSPDLLEEVSIEDFSMFQLQSKTLRQSISNKQFFRLPTSFQPINIEEL